MLHDGLKSTGGFAPPSQFSQPIEALLGFRVEMDREHETRLAVQYASSKRQGPARLCDAHYTKVIGPSAPALARFEREEGDEVGGDYPQRVGEQGDERRAGVGEGVSGFELHVQVKALHGRAVVLAADADFLLPEEAGVDDA